MRQPEPKGRGGQWPAFKRRSILLTGKAGEAIAGAGAATYPLGMKDFG